MREGSYDVWTMDDEIKADIPLALGAFRDRIPSHVDKSTLQGEDGREATSINEYAEENKIFS